MCLAKITAKYDKPLKLDKPRIGYKVFEVHNHNENIRNAFAKFVPTVEFEKSVWIEDQHDYNIRIKEDRYWVYKSGFHIFTTLEDAEKFSCLINTGVYYSTKTFKVEYNDIVAEGVDESGFHTIVARSLKICV